jgi:hypothetical protein
MAHDVFISYSSKDKPFANAICAALDKQNIKYWIADRDIPSSTEYGGAIVKAINASSVFVLVFSANSDRSEDVLGELNLARKKRIPIIPFRIEEVQPSEGVAYYISHIDWLDAFTPPLETHLERLVGDVKSLLEGKPLPPPPPPPPPPARDWKPILIAAGVVLAISIFALWRLNSSTEPTDNGGGGTTVVTDGSPAVVSPLDKNVNGTQPITGDTPINVNTPTTTSTPTPEATITNDQQEYERAIGLLHDANPANARLGIQLLGKVCKSANEDLYWAAMNQLTDYVRDNARWNDKASQLNEVMRTNVQRILEVIAARRPPYPDGANDAYKRDRRRNLESTDLRGLKLVGSVAELEYVSFRGANLEGAVLRGARLEGAAFNRTILRGVDFYGADMMGVDLTDANLNGAKLRHAKRLNPAYLGVAYTWHCADLDEELRKKLTDDNAPRAKCE